jgi:hypothetical protein
MRKAISRDFLCCCRGFGDEGRNTKSTKVVSLRAAVFPALERAFENRPCVAGDSKNDVERETGDDDTQSHRERDKSDRYHQSFLSVSGIPLNRGHAFCNQREYAAPLPQRS